MKFFIDTADVEEIRDLAATGLVDGVTTNPSLVAKSGRDFFDVLKEICALVEGPVSAEVTGDIANSLWQLNERLGEGEPLFEIKDRRSVREAMLAEFSEHQYDQTIGTIKPWESASGCATQ